MIEAISDLQISSEEESDSRITRLRGIAFSAAFWIGMCIAVGIAAIILRVPISITLCAISLALVPGALTWFSASKEPASSDEEFAVFGWLTLAIIATCLTGGANSPLTVFFALAPLHALAIDRTRLAVEASIFGSIGFVAAHLMVATGFMPSGLISPPALTGLGALAGIIQIGVFLTCVSFNLQDASTRSKPIQAAPQAQPVAEPNKYDETHDAQLNESLQFYASLGHELKNMVNPVSGYAELILSERAGKIDETYLGFARSIKQGADHLDLLIDDLMTSTKSRSGKLSLHSETLDLRSEIEETITLMALHADASSLKLKLDQEQDLWVKADRKALRQIVMNLVSNAIKYARPQTEIEIKITSNETLASIRVIDHGEGMAPEDLQRITDPYVQGANAKGRQGTGLGLHVVRTLVEQMDGKFSMRSRLNVGTTAAFTLPIAYQPD